ncbi:MAG TPA: porin, partial [Nitrospira sp.]|nr:porin [Nitrospira sp.]
MIHLLWVCWVLLSLLPAPSLAEEPASTSQLSASFEPPPGWHYGAYLDLSYIQNFNYPENHLWRSRTTTQRNNELTPNMALIYVRKDATESSRWGTELGVQGGYDTDNFAFLIGESKVSGADTLRQIHRANV